ncbi:MAG: hypothetical protein HN380_35045, partial [Victivallales bacterium]|nr:hypothetical protein [Victivallales bacterium]
VDGATISPAAEEMLNFVDDNCNSITDEGTSFFDDDGDGQTEAVGDCNDDDPGVHTGAAELCDLLDQDCDFEIDEDFDGDGDGHTTCAGDCDDGDGAVYPGNPEVCDTIDNDCDGLLENVPAIDVFDGSTAAGVDLDLRYSPTVAGLGVLEASWTDDPGADGFEVAIG